MIRDTRTRCFGQRMLSPFSGIMHCIVNDSADAVTTDGRVWTLYVRGECLYDDLPDLDHREVTIPDVKYGQWSAKRGFRRAPIRLPTFDARVREEGDRLLQAVQQHANEVHLLNSKLRQSLEALEAALRALPSRDDAAATPEKAVWH